MRKHKYYLVYRTENIITGDYYLGMHQTNVLNDGYLGSGKRLKNSISKYGIENFRRRILKYCASRVEMIWWEKKYIAKHLGRKKCLNLAEGGHGGWTYVNQQPEKKSRNIWGERNVHYGTCWISHDSSQLTMRVRREEVQDYLDAGWRAGRCMRYQHVRAHLLELP